MMMMMFRSCSLSQPLSALSALLVCALCTMLASVVESQKISSSNTMHGTTMHGMHSMHGLGCTTKIAEDGSSRKVCATAFESSSLEHDTRNRITHKEIHIKDLNATINVSYHGEKCRINYNGQMCSSCYLCADDNEIAYDCANLPNGRCTVQKCERILQLADPTGKHSNGRVKQFMLPVDLGQTLPLPRKCDMIRFPVLADTWTDPKHPNQSMEEKKRLRMSNANRYSLIKFKVTNLMDGVSQGVGDAFLRIKTVDKIPSLSVRLPEDGYASSGIASDTWDEQLKTYHFLSGTSLVDNMVDFEQHSKPIATKQNLSGRHWYSFDVSNVVTKNGVYTFLLKTDTPGIIVGVYGKGTDYEPELIVRPVLPYIPIGKNTRPPTYTTLPSDIPSSFPTESNIPSSPFPSLATTPPPTTTRMEDQNYKGYCVDGYYGGNKMNMMGLNDPDDLREDLQKCLEQCMAETECRYAAFRMGTACSRFTGKDSGFCDTNEGRTSDDNFNLYKRVAS